MPSFQVGVIAVGRMRPDLVKGAEGGPITLPGASAWRDTLSPECLSYQLRTEFHSGDLQPGSVGESARFSFTSYTLETRPPSKAVFCLVTYLSAVNLWLQIIHPKNQGKDREIEYIQFFFNISFHEGSEFSVYVFLLICCASFLARICLQI